MFTLKLSDRDRRQAVFWLGLAVGAVAVAALGACALAEVLMAVVEKLYR